MRAQQFLRQAVIEQQPAALGGGDILFLERLFRQIGGMQGVATVQRGLHLRDQGRRRGRGQPPAPASKASNAATIQPSVPAAHRVPPNALKLDNNGEAMP